MLIDNNRDLENLFNDLVYMEEKIKILERKVEKQNQALGLLLNLFEMFTYMNEMHHDDNKHKLN